MIHKNYLKQVFLCGIVFAYICLGTMQVSAQQAIARTITVKDGSSSSPLEGATVINLNSNMSTSTNAQGVAHLVAAQDDILRASLLGYLTQTIVVSAQETVQISLGSQQQNISEVVVTALGTSNP